MNNVFVYCELEGTTIADVSLVFQGQADRSSIFLFVFQELQQVLPSLPDQHSNNRILGTQDNLAVPSGSR